VCVRERENLVFDSLIYLEPVERFKNRNNAIDQIKDQDLVTARSAELRTS